jgi:hypothetical protein
VVCFGSVSAAALFFGEADYGRFGQPLHRKLVYSGLLSFLMYKMQSSCMV